ncbi:multicopper oxidase family protein [Tahibacter sp.]|uniref:multicopper oxidase family protein n=1 Tax=Tahibacter sp. TaxID=2056211 RepID=UPI0028C38450|nr:multicopper oxidase family protein [Tahibacter sp.]
MRSTGAFGTQRSAARVNCGRVRYALPAVLLAVAVTAQAADRVDAPPVAAQIKRAAEMVRKGAAESVESLHGMRLPAVAPHEAKLALDIDFTESTIFNPATGKDDRVKLRSYRSPGTDPKIPFVAPLIEIQPGETVRIALNNKLPKEPDCARNIPSINTPHCFNSTNLHSHGLWVSPSGNSDNVLIALLPGVQFEYEYNIPADHPSGTFWYHPHMHGSTALQVASGMAGTLIVRGNRRPTDQHNGDIDTLLVEKGERITERVVQLQQVQYACRDKETDKIKTRTVEKDGKQVVVAWVCDEGDIGQITRYDDQFGQTSWIESGRYTSINGQVLPTFTDARAGAIERWRVVHAGVRNSVNLQFKKMKGDAKAFDRLAVAEQQSWIDANCTGDALPQFEIASDGLTHTQAIRKSSNVLQPGYRSDVLVVFPQAGDYCVIDADATADSSVSWTAESRQLLGKVVVGKGGSDVAGDPQPYVIKTLSAMADATQDPSVVAKVKSDLANGLHLDAFVPHPTIPDSELTNRDGKPAQEMQFSIVSVPDPADPTKKVTNFQVDNAPYNPKEARQLVLGRVEEWKLTSISGSHPFHIHVNPFQIDRVIDTKNGNRDVSVPGSGDTSYDGLKGTWKDTLWIKAGFDVYVRTRYERYIGEYVLHCHILDHEDQGMMQNVRVVLPDGKGGGTYGHH